MLETGILLSDEEDATLIPFISFIHFFHDGKKKTDATIRR